MYQDKCTHNAKISRKGVEAKAEKKLMESTNKTQINPLGNITNPELPKDKVISKEKDKGKDEFKLNVKSENKVEDVVQVESSKIDEDFIILDSFKELVKIDISKLEDNEDFQYVNNCRILAQDAGWFGFFQLIFNSSIKELPELIKIHKSSLDEYSLLEIRKHRNFYIKKLLNK